MKRLKLFGMTALAVMAISAVASATASAAPRWMYRAHSTEAFKELSGSETFSSTISSAAFELETPGLLTIKCTSESSTGTITNPAETSKPGTDTSSKIRFDDCVVVGAEKTCKIVGGSSGTEEGIIETVATNTVLKAGAGTKVYDVFTPSSGKVFVTIKVENQTGKTCLVKGSYPVEGNSAGEVEHQAGGAELKFSKAIAEAAGTELKLGGDKAYLTGVADQKLTGTKAGDEFTG